MRRLAVPFDGAPGAPLSLWLVSLGSLPAAATLAELSPAERARAERFRQDRDRRRYLASHAALRQLLAQHLGESAAGLRFDEGRHGKPRLVDHPDCHFNLSHSGELALIGIGSSAEIGVDIETLVPMPDAEALARLHYTVAEQESLGSLSAAARDEGFLRLWTRKEACLKALGTGLSLAPSTFDVGLAPGPVGVTIGGSAGRPGRLEVCDIPTGAAAVAAIAWLAA
ncbi:4'-phosphopantetheinyl transferase superfamily protein [uncultured Methylibium sp.]|uniref:4'-phosphopantetheinyl transferase family protein n=1 Tax=uncultured Methylibium sp. TaxID=381093 RepID=UPI0025D7F568|nr:4'-phosphopantetheinyl transferase superfamily protein [uncultured Methylibium sp.]